MTIVSRSPKTWPYAQSSSQDSVGKLLGTLHPGLLSDILCWEAKGEARRLFESSLKKSILDYLLEHSDKAQESGSYLSIPLFMVGKRPKRAKPVVMLVSDDKVARKEAYDLILHSDIMAKYPGFELGHSDFEKLMAWAGDTVSVFSLQQEGASDCYRLISGQDISDKEVSGRKILAGASLGALRTESITRAHNAYEDRSGDGDASPNRNSAPKQGLGLAAAALAVAGAAKYLQAGKVEKEEGRRGRSQSRGYYSSGDEHSSSRSRSRSRRRQRSISVSDKAAVGLVQHFRNKSRTRSQSRSESRLRSGSRSKSMLKRSISTSAKPGSIRTATAGGVVSHMGKHMLLSISHFLRDSPSIESPAHKFEASQISDCEITGLGDFDDDDDDDTDTDFVETVRQGSVSDVDESKDSEMDDSYPPTSASESDRNSQRRLSISPQEPSSPEGRLIGKGNPVICSEEFDYALFEVDMNSPSESLLDKAISLTDLDKIESGPRNTAVKTVASNGRVVHGLMSEDTLPVRLPHSKEFTEVYTAIFFGSLGPGDCGGWVRDKATGRLFGHVFAGNLSNGLTAIMPAKLVFEHARAQLDEQFALKAPQNQHAEFSFSALKDKIEYYFSIENLAGDRYLRARMDSQGFVPLYLITSFKGMRQLTDDIDIVRAACEFSVELDFAVGDDGIERVRRSQGWESFVLPLEDRDESARNHGPAYLAFKNRQLKPHHKLQELKQSTLQSMDDDNDSTYSSSSVAEMPLSLPSGTSNIFGSNAYNPTGKDKLVKKYVCRDPTAAGLYSDVKPDVPLSQCPECSSGKKYNAYYMAADHLRRRHFQRHYQETLINSNSRVVRLSSAVSDLRLWTEEVFVKMDGPLGSSIVEVTEDEASHSTEKVSPSHDVDSTENVSPSHDVDSTENVSPSHDVDLTENVSPSHNVNLTKNVSPSYDVNLTENVSPSHDVDSSIPSFQPLTDAPFPYSSIDRVEHFATLYPSWEIQLPGLSFSPHSVSTATPSSVANSPYQLYNVGSHGPQSQFQVIRDALDEVPSSTFDPIQGHELYQLLYHGDPLAPTFDKPLEGSSPSLLPPSAAYAPKPSATPDYPHALYDASFSPLTSPVLTSPDYPPVPVAAMTMDEISSSIAPILKSRQAIARRSSGRLSKLLGGHSSSDQRRKSSTFLCTLCNDHPGGFRGPHELDRHMRRHNSNKMTKKFICRDPASVGIKPDVEAMNPLSKCEACSAQKHYDTANGAIAHLYIEHMRDPSTGKLHAVKGIRTLTEQLKDWCCEVQVDGNGRILTQAGDTNAALQAKEGDISDFLTALDSKKTLESFAPGRKGESATSRTVAQLSKFHLMRESNNALTESMTSSMQLDSSSTVSSRQPANLTSISGTIYTASDLSAMDCDDDNEDTEMTSDIPEPSGLPPADTGGFDVQEVVCSNCSSQVSQVWQTSPEGKPLCVDCRNLPTSQDSVQPSHPEMNLLSSTSAAAHRERKAQGERDHAPFGGRRSSSPPFPPGRPTVVSSGDINGTANAPQQHQRSIKRPRRVTACIECRKRKTRCDGHYPCLSCQMANRLCGRASNQDSFKQSASSDTEGAETHMAPRAQENISKSFANMANAFKNSLLSRQPERELARNRSRSITRSGRSQATNMADASSAIGIGGNAGVHDDVSEPNVQALQAGLATTNDVVSDGVRHLNMDNWPLK
ncbi:transcriptional regulator family: Fungal Specific TF [Trichoderma aggressivum f. europaeum]|uniref:Transcriptional regulator family: Fungal Specific TF n=1 Tax=Trichoderma aggressivum f. europaeum TaxID=173218 RepID=A0AAE1IAA6_9HYPO|nr:transcriptional regulator family: Fungal Specific TF [Trichoderma aggressivum f. europaeum]